MPKLPMYFKQAQYSGQAGNVQMDASSAGIVNAAQMQMGNTIAQAGGQIADTADNLYDKFAKARNYHQELESDLKLVDGITELSSRASQDQNIENNLQKYENEANSILSESIKGIQDPTIRDKAFMRGQMKLASVKSSLSDLARKNIGEKAIVNTEIMVDKDINEYATTGDKYFLESALSRIDALQEKGFLKPEKAYELKKKKAEMAKDAAYSYDMQTNPALAGERLDKNYYGYDIEKLGRAKAQYDREMKKVINVNEEAALDLYLDNKLTEDVIKTMRSEGKVDAKFAVSMIDKVNKGDSYKTDPNTYMNAVDIVLSPNMTAKAKRDYLVEMLNAQQISDSDFKNLYRNGISGGASVATMYMAEKMDEDERLQNASKTPTDMKWIKSAVDTIKGNSILNNIDTVAATMMLFKAIGEEGLKGQSIASTAKSLVRDFVVARYPSVGQMKDLPNKIFDGSEVKTVYAGENDLKPTKQFEPKREDLDVGDKVSVGNTDYRVVGFDSDGEPLVDAE